MKQTVFHAADWTAPRERGEVVRTLCDIYPPIGQFKDVFAMPGQSVTCPKCKEKLE